MVLEDFMLSAVSNANLDSWRKVGKDLCAEKVSFFDEGYDASFTGTIKDRGLYVVKSYSL